MEKKILEMLKQRQGEYVSGQEMSEVLQVSRMTISTQIKKLKECGYDILTSTRKGNCIFF